MRIYLDSAPIIYLVEDIAPYASALEARLVVPGTVQVCSDLTRLECRVKPMRDRQDVLLAAFDRYFADAVSEVIPLSPKVVDQATVLRAHYGFKTPDAIHLAAAIVSRIDIWTTDSATDLPDPDAAGDGAGPHLQPCPGCAARPLPGQRHQHGHRWFVPIRPDSLQLLALDKIVFLPIAVRD